MSLRSPLFVGLTAPLRASAGVGGGGALPAVNGDIIAAQIMDSSALPGGSNIDGNGTILRVRLKGLAANIGGSYDTTKLAGLGYRPGWNTSKSYSTTNIASVIEVTSKIVRQPYPNEANRMELAVGSDLDIYFFLTEEWYLADTIDNVAIASGFYTGSNASSVSGAAVTNSSTRAYRMPQFSWVGLEPWRRMTSSGLTVEAIVDHYSARNAQPVPAMDFYVTRSAVTSSVTVNAMVLSDEVTAPYRPGVFRGTVPIGSLTQGEADLGAIIYPWVGNASWDTNSAEFETFPCVGTPKLMPVNIDTDGSYELAGAYISHTGVQIGTPTIGLLSAMGAYVPDTTPAYANIKALADAGKAYNNSASRARAHNTLAGIRAVVPSGYQAPLWGASAMNNQTNYPPGFGWFGVTREAGSSIATTGLTTNATLPSTRAAIPSRTMLDGLGLFPGAAGATHTLTDGGTGASTTQQTKAAAIYLVVRDCSGTGVNDNTHPLFTRAGYRWLHRNSFISCGDDIISSNSGQFNGVVHLHGCTVDNNTNTVGALCHSASIIGCDLRSVQINGLASGASPDVLGKMVHSVRIENNDDGAPTFTIIAICQLGVRPIGVRGESYLNVLIRKTASGQTAGILGAGESPSMQISSDYVSTTVDQPAVTNINIGYVTGAGARRNGPYNEAGDLLVTKEVREFFCAWSQRNTKGDLFNSGGAPGASGNRTGTFAHRHGGSRLGIVTGDNSANAATPYTPGSWLGDLPGKLCQDNVGYANMFVSDTSLAGTNNYADLGNFAPQSALFNRVPSGRAATKYDLNGALRLDNGSGAAGAIER